ncbi:hypothetical protein LN042_11490 [Kitasatospora sp. RB6PN24]|uniref:hypothetical protein n=1 Tax=Kitasatospora humi TaxID=2893891 RepID=UPI001E3DF07D|nr:hypothetical protein [Kitasatospora humi]MCC9307712.1 hypothetical protein [Kitasatospora humi]
MSDSTQRTSLAQQLERATTAWQSFGDTMHRLMTSVGATRPQLEAIRAQLEALAQASPSALNAEYRRRQRARVKRRRR